MPVFNFVALIFVALTFGPVPTDATDTLATTHPPLYSPHGSCSAHSDCAKMQNHYCDKHQRCMTCRDCWWSTDSIDNQCKAPCGHNGIFDGAPACTHHLRGLTRGMGCPIGLTCAVDVVDDKSFCIRCDPMQPDAFCPLTNVLSTTTTPPTTTTTTPPTKTNLDNPTWLYIKDIRNILYLMFGFLVFVFCFCSCWIRRILAMHVTHSLSGVTQPSTPVPSSAHVSATV